MPPSLAIGDFARATHLSVKTLRHYHQLGLLVPAEIDPGSGYRRYAVEQIPTAQVIRRFRDLDMPLEQIGDVLRADDVRTRNDLIALHLARLEEGLAETQAAVASLRDLLQGPPPSTRIEHRREGAMQVAAISDVVDVENLGPWFEGAIAELYATLAAQGVPTPGPPGSVVSNELFSDERGEVTIFLPSSAPVRHAGRVSPEELPAVELATITHAGPHDDIDRAYGSLAAYVAEHALAITGPIRERYVVGRHDTPDPASWRTEIGWPIFHTGPPALDVRVVPAVDTLPLRQRVLRPHQTIDELARERDEDRDAAYFAAIEDDGTVVGTASVHPEAPPWPTPHARAWRLRDMATDEVRRRRRIGTAVLNAVVEYVQQRGGDLLWCNARVPAVGFYERAGFTTRGESWTEPMLGPHVAMQRAIDPRGS